MLVNIFGKRGSGKTYLIKHVIPNCVAPVIVFDILNNYNNLENSEETSKMTDVMNFLKNHYNYKKSPDFYGKPKNNILIVKPHDVDLFIDFISAGLWQFYGGTLVLDEADAINYQNAPQFDSLIRYGRNRGIHLLTGCRRPYELSRNITAGANAIYIFQTQEPRDIEYYSKTLIGKDLSLKLASLPEFTGIFINYDSKIKGIFKVTEDGKVIILETFNEKSF